MKTLSGEINKADYKCKHEFFPKRVTDSFIYENLTPKSYSNINSHTSCTFEILNLTAIAKSIVTSKFS